MSKVCFQQNEVFRADYQDRLRLFVQQKQDSVEVLVFDRELDESRGRVWQGTANTIEEGQGEAVIAAEGYLQANLGPLRWERYKDEISNL